MRTIIAIGGGEIGGDGSESETIAIDRSIIAKTGVDTPNILFIPTASNDSEGYINLFHKYYVKTLSCDVDVLRLYSSSDSYEDCSHKINKADVVYVGGGNPTSMLNMWKKKGIDHLLKEAYEKGIILSGLSAGAICWFKKALSDTLKSLNPEAPLSIISMLGFNSLSVCPHFDVDLERRPEFKMALKKSGEIGFGIDNCAAMQVVDGTDISTIVSKENVHVWMCFWNENNYYEFPLQNNMKYKISELNLLDNTPNLTSKNVKTGYSGIRNAHGTYL
jgi:dipeptidase E